MGKLLKPFLVIFTSLLALTTVSSAFVLYFSKIDNSSFLGEKIKSWAIKRPWIVNLADLNQPGDARYLYIGKQSSIVKVNIYYQYGLEPNQDIIIWLRDLISQTTRKNITLDKYSLDDIFSKDQYTDEDLEKIIDSFPKKGKDPVVNLVYLGTYEDQSYMGLTLTRDTIFLFEGYLKGFEESEGVLANLEKSTIMHEWGHLLGLGHVDNDNCVMSEKMHLFTNRGLHLHEVVTQYCPETLYQLEMMR